MTTFLNFRRIAAVSLCISSVVLASACSRPDAASNSSEQNYLTIKGSDTMVHLVTHWAEAFMNAEPDSEISVTGGGSGTGIAALLNDTADICMASRKMKAKEFDLATEQGLSLEEIVVARDGIAIIVNPNNPIDALTVDQIGAMYTGATKSWRAVGGPDQPISVLSRESSSGTYVFFQEHVLKKQDYAASARLIPATSGIVQAVSTDRWTIGYVGLAYALQAGDAVKILGVQRNEDASVVLPSEATVQSGDYAVARPLQLYASGPTTPLAQRFFAFCLGAEGQAIVRETGYVPIASDT